MGTGRPRGTSPTTASPKRSAPIAATTTAAATITISTQGQRGPSPRRNSRARRLAGLLPSDLRVRAVSVVPPDFDETRKKASSVSTSRRVNDPSTYAISAKVLPDGTDIPVILPSWLTIMSTAMPAM